jgi:hypothetical protein
LLSWRSLARFKKKGLCGESSSLSSPAFGVLPTYQHGLRPGSRGGLLRRRRRRVEPGDGVGGGREGGMQRLVPLRARGVVGPSPALAAAGGAHGRRSRQSREGARGQAEEREPRKLFFRGRNEEVAAFLLLFLFVGSASRHYKKKKKKRRRKKNPASNFTPPPSCRSGTPPSRASAPGSAPSRSRSTANAACPTDP